MAERALTVLVDAIVRLRTALERLEERATRAWWDRWLRS